MNEITIEELLENLIHSCSLGVVKHLNREIMDRETARENFERAEKIEDILEKEGIPIVPALTFHGSKMQKVEGNYFYIFKWQEGHITDWYNISEVNNTIDRIKYIRSMEKELKEALDLRLRRIEPARYDNHDERIVKALTGHC